MILLSTIPVPIAMHAPDGFFSTWLALLGWLITIGLISVALRHTRTELGEKQVPLMGVLAATIFAGQMINFTIPGGTSGHLLGGALAAIILGPWAAVLIMTSVVAIQALVFQDGGLLVMGLNILNMGIITSFVGFFVFRIIRQVLKGQAGLILGGFMAGWLSVMATAAFAAIELALSGTSPLAFALPAMVGVHALIGIGEGLLTVFALTFLLTARPDLLRGDNAAGQREAGYALAGLALALGITLFSPLSSGYLDGMERVALALQQPDDVVVQPVGFIVPEEQQFFGETQDAPYETLPDYTVPVVKDQRLSTIFAGVIGVLIVFAVGYGLARLNRLGVDSSA